MITDTTGVARKIADGIGTVLDELGKRFGATGAHLWQLMVKQVYVHAVVCGVEWLLLFAFTIGTFVWMKHSWKNAKPKTYTWEGPSVLCIVSTVVAVLSGVACVACAFGTAEVIVQAIMNPEYQALANVLDLIHST